MATHSSVLAWRIPGTAEPSGLPSIGLHRVGHDWSNLAACLLSQWCYPTISSSVTPFSCPQSFLASGFFPMNHIRWQHIGASASASVLPMNIQGWFPLGLLVWSPCSPRDSQESSPTPQLKTSILQCSGFFMVQLSHPYMTTGKTIALVRQTFASKAMSLLFNMLSRCP